MVHGLQREGHDHDVEGVVLEVAEPLVDVVLQHGDTTLQAGEHALIRDLHAQAIGTAAD